MRTDVSRIFLLKLKETKCIYDLIYLYINRNLWNQFDESNVDSSKENSYNNPSRWLQSSIWLSY